MRKFLRFQKVSTTEISVKFRYFTLQCLYYRTAEAYSEPFQISKIKPLGKKCQYSELFWSVFSSIWTEYGEIRSISPYSIRVSRMRTRMTSNTDTFHTVSILGKLLTTFRQLFILLDVLRGPKSTSASITYLKYLCRNMCNETFLEIEISQ